MKTRLLATLVLCIAAVPALAASGTAASPAASAGPAPAPLAADTPMSTALGNTFVAPAGWIVRTAGNATLLEPPEGGSRLMLLDVPLKDAATAEAAIAAAWAAYPGGSRWKLKVVTPIGDRDGWTNRAAYEYETSPNEKRDVQAQVRRANDTWTVLIYDMAQAVGEKRAAQVGQVLGKLLPKGRTRESFAGRRAKPLDAARIAELTRFVEKSMELTKVPGVALVLHENGRTVYAGGFGVRELGSPERVDADTKFMIASNTKAMVTLMLARLVADGKLAWDTPAVQALPGFRLGNAETTRQVQIKHLICACTGMPRQDLEFILEFADRTPDAVIRALGTMQPTSGFGELFQYSNTMAAAAGYIGGHVAYPDLELGAAYDRAMQTLVFDPLGMKSATHDFAVGGSGNWARPHAQDVDGRTTRAEHRMNYAVYPDRPAGGVWASANDVMKYVAMELAEGRLPDGRQYIPRDVLLERRAPQVLVGTDVTYGMGLQVNAQHGTPVVHHGGDVFGIHSDMMWLPEHGVGAVILTNGTPGYLIRTALRRKLLEVLFDGAPEAEAQIAAGAKAHFEQIAAERRLLTVPADPAASKRLAARYSHPALGAIVVERKGAATVFDFGEFESEVATKQNPDGTTSFVTIVPGFVGLEFVAGPATLTLRDAQHEYVLKAE